MNFNGIDFLDRASYPWLIIEEAYPPELIGRKNQWHAPAGGQARLVRSYRAPYARKVKVRILASSRADAMAKRRELIGKLTTPDVAKLTLQPETLYELAKLEEVQGDNWAVNTLPITLVFYCPHGCAFGLTKSAPIGSIVVTGTETAPPKLTITPTATTVQVSNGKGQVLRFEGIALTPALIVDAEKRTAMQGTTSRMPNLTLASDFFELQPGVNVLGISDGSGTVEYIERWA